MPLLGKLTVSKMKNKKAYIERAFGSEPVWNGDTENLDVDVLRAINWYVGGDKKNYKKWTIEWMKSKDSPWTKDQIDLVRRCPLSDFKHFGHYCRMLSRGFPATESINKVVNTELNSLIDKGKNKKDSRKENSISPHERMREQVSEFAGELMEICDKGMESIKEKKTYHKTFKFDDWLQQRDVGYKQSEMLGELFSPALAELDELLKGKDKQLVEGYSFLKKPQQKQLHKFMMSLVTSCFKRSASNKPVRRKRRISPRKIVSKVQYLQIHKEYGLKSVDPIDLIDSKKVVVYNTRYNILGVYYAKEHETMTVKGTTIQNFCPQKSECRTIKNPTKIIKTIKNESSLDKIWNAQHSMIKSPNGRLNEHTVILKVFK